VKPTPLTHQRPGSPRLAAVIVNYRSWPDVVRLASELASAPEVAAGLAEVVVVDNASGDPIPPEFQGRTTGLRLIARPDNGGFAVGVNAAWKATSAHWLLLLNPDVVADRTLIRRTLERLGRIPEGSPTGVIGFGLRNPDGSRQPSVGAFPGLARTLREQFIPRSRRKYQAGWRTLAGPVDWVTGACVLVSARMMAELGGMDEDFFLYHEEVALCRAARDSGWGVAFDPGIEVVHLRPLQDRPISPKMRVIIRHSKLLYFRKHLPLQQFVALSWIVELEARLRGRWDRGDRERASAWRAIADLAGRMRQGEPIRGRGVLHLAEEAVAGRGPHGSRRSPARKDGTA